MITVVIGTNRANSFTSKVAAIYCNLLNENNAPFKLLNLHEKNILYRNHEMLDLEKDYLLDADKFIFIIPEYNGSFPGIFKLMIDNSDIRKCWWNKKALLVGVADGRAGNLRGLEHLTNILHYLRMYVHYNKIAISKIKNIMTENGELHDKSVELEISNQIKSFLEY